MKLSVCLLSFDYLEMTGKLFWKAVFIFLLEEGAAIKEAIVESSLHAHPKAGIQATVLKYAMEVLSSCGLQDNRRLGTSFQKANKELLENKIFLSALLAYFLLAYKQEKFWGTLSYFLNEVSGPFIKAMKKYGVKGLERSSSENSRTDQWFAKANVLESWDLGHQSGGLKKEPSFFRNIYRRQGLQIYLSTRI